MGQRRKKRRVRAQFESICSRKGAKAQRRKGARRKTQDAKRINEFRVFFLFFASLREILVKLHHYQTKKQIDFLTEQVYRAAVQF